jgi:hypothetical protein
MDTDLKIVQSGFYYDAGSNNCASSYVKQEKI